MSSFFSGRLGLDDSGIRQDQRAALIYLDRGVLSALDGGLIFTTEASIISLPVQTITTIMIGPGSSVTHDALRLLSHYGVCLIATGVDGVRCYTAPAVSSAVSGLARQHAALWADQEKRVLVARRMYAIRFGELLPHRNMNVLRGIEGARVKTEYDLLAKKYGVSWYGRRFDRANPEASDLPNMAINHASVAVEAAATIAVTSVGAIPQLGFIHEDPGQSFILDVADLYRSDITISGAFIAIKSMSRHGNNLERSVRMEVGKLLRERHVIDRMIGIIKGLLLEQELPISGKTV